MRPPERSPERDEAILALLPNVPFDGWTSRALRAALRSTGQTEDDAVLLFPGGAADLVEAWSDLADRRMEEAAAGLGLEAMRISERVRAIVALRLHQNRPHKEAVRRALGLLALPGHAGAALACTARTVDAIWHAAGDQAADFSWYTKRAILASVYTGTLLFWIRDQSEDDAPTLAFLDRQLGRLARMGRARRRAGELPSPRRVG